MLHTKKKRTRTQNPKGYTIPLDKRLAADGRGLQEVQINDNFAKLSEVAYLRHVYLQNISDSFFNPRRYIWQSIKRGKL